MALDEIDKDFSRSWGLAVVQDPVEIAQDIAIDDPIVVERNGIKVVPGLVPWPANDATARLLTYYTQPFPPGVDKMPAAMLAGGVIATARLAVTLTDEAKAALTGGTSSDFIFLDKVIPA